MHAGESQFIGVDVEDCADILLRFGSGAQCAAHLDFVQRGSTRSCKVVGEQGTASWDFARRDVQLLLADNDVAQSLAYTLSRMICTSLKWNTSSIALPVATFRW